MAHLPSANPRWWAVLFALTLAAIAATERSAHTTDSDVVYPPGSGIYNVRNYGAAGDGSTDDTAAITRAMTDAFEHRGNLIYFPSGTYLISDTLLWATAGKPPAQAVAHIDMKRGCLNDISVQNGGHGYVGLFGGGPAVLLSGGGGWGASPFAQLKGDSVAAITFDTTSSCTGSGYTSAPAVRVVNFQAWLGFQGQNQATTRIRLIDRAPGFGDGHCVPMYNSGAPGPYCKAMLSAASVGASNPLGGGESAYFTDVQDLTIDTGAGNAGAIGVDWAASNTAVIRNVTITGASGRVGLNTSKGWGGGGNGPALVSNLVVNGFDYGIVSGAGEVGLTFEHVSLNRQKTVGFWNQNQNIWIRDLKTADAAPAVINQDNGNMALVDSTLAGGAAGTAAIVNRELAAAPHLFARNVSISGYASAIRQERGPGNQAVAVASSVGGEFQSDNTIRLSAAAGSSLKLPVRETPPSFADNNFANWAIVTAYGATPNDTADDTGGIQAALNSGKPTVFLPAGTYQISGTLHIPRTVRKILGTVSQITIRGGGRATYPVFSCDADNGGPIEIRRLTFDISTVGSPSIMNRCAVPLVLADLFDVNGYENAPGKGLEVYFENVAIPGPVIQHGGNVWARQLDVENDTTHVLNDGAAFWILGYKTEGAGNHGLGLFYTKNGGRTEILGAFNSTPGDGRYEKAGYTTVDSVISIAALSAGRSLETVLLEDHGGSVNRYPNNGLRYGGTAVALYTNNPNRDSR